MVQSDTMNQTILNYNLQIHILFTFKNKVDLSESQIHEFHVCHNMQHMDTLKCTIEYKRFNENYLATNDNLMR